MIRKITPDGVVTTLAGTVDAVGTGGMQGYQDGPGASALFNIPSSLTVDAQDNLYVVETGNCAVRKITPSGFVSTVVGTAKQCEIKPGSFPALINTVSGIAITPTGQLVLTSENAILSITGL